MPANNEVRNIDLFGNLLSLKQDIFDAVHPIGETYTQYPQQDPPATLYNKNGITSEWEPISYDGAFFRAEGTNANPFTEKGTGLNVQGYQNAYHNHGMWHQHAMDHQHYMNHQHYSGGTTGGCSDRGTDSAGSHSHSVYKGSYRATGWYGSGAGAVGQRFDGGATNDDSTYITTDSAGGHSHTINDHTHSFGAWSGGSCYLGTDTGRDYVDGAVKFNGSQYIDRSLTDNAIVWNGTQYVDRSGTEFNGNVTDQESRPRNLTIRIWRRKA